MDMRVNGYVDPENKFISVTINGAQGSVPNDMGNRHRQMIAEWEAEGNTIPPYAAPGPTASDVKAEAARRILTIMPEYKQRNSLAMFAEAVQNYGSDPAGWPSDLQAVNRQAMMAWGAIKAIRAKSNIMDAADPIPPDFTDDKYWSDK